MSYYRHGPVRPGGSGIRFGVPPVTTMIKYIVIACAVVWLLQLTLTSVGVNSAYLLTTLGLVPANVLGRGFLWQPVTYMFLHDPSGPFHLLFNMLMLWMFGGELERYWGPRAFLRYYLVCGVGGGICAAIMGFLPGGDPSIPTIGASGAIFGVFMAYGMIFSERVVLFMLIFPMKARTMAFLMFALSFFYLLSQSRGGVSHIAHLGGGLTGLLYLKRAWRIGALYRELKWKLQRRKFKVMEPPDDDRWIH